MRVVPLIGPTVAALQAQRKRVLELRMHAGAAWHDLDLVFPCELGTPLHPANVQREYKKLLRRVVLARYRQQGALHGDTAAGFERWLAAQPHQQAFLRHRLHDLRHSTATYLLAAGVDQRIVMQIMGWSQLSMLVRYQHVLDSTLEDAAARLEAVFPGAARSG